jgi:hypothetical protein
MNKAAGGIASLIESVPQDYTVEEFSSLVAELDHALLSGKVQWSYAKEVLTGLLRGHTASPAVAVWKTLSLRKGFAYKKIEDYRRSQLSDYYRGLFEEFEPGFFKLQGFTLMVYEHSYAQEHFERAFVLGEDKVDLVRVSPKQFGFTDLKRVSRSAFFEAALQAGFEKCFYEIALALRLTYLDQPCGEWLTVATDTNIPDYLDRMLRVGRGRKEDPLCVFATVRDPKSLIAVDEEFVFIKPRAEPQT